MRKIEVRLVIMLCSGVREVSCYTDGRVICERACGAVRAVK